MENECDACSGTGYICSNCSEGIGDCICEDQFEEECPDCDGQGTTDEDDSWGV